MTDQIPQAQEIHKPFSDDGVLYCGWATGERVVDGCGELFPCTTLRTTPNALALAPTVAVQLLGCGNCDGLAGNPRCPACKGAGRMPRHAHETREARAVRREVANEIAAAIEAKASDTSYSEPEEVTEHLLAAAQLARQIGAEETPS